MEKLTKTLAGIMLALMVVYTSGCENNNGKTTGDTVNETTNETVAEKVGETVNAPLEVNALGYVDLGLPSGNLWASCNVGANAPEENGDYFAWGEVVKKSTYEWLTYKYCADGERGKLTKYCPYASEGNHDFRDAFMALQSCDDAATAVMGDDWRMPTKEEFKELFRNADRMWTSRNGVNGYLFTARNGSGNSIFIPAAGYSLDGEAISVGHEGFYWSSMLFDGIDLIYDDPNLAWCVMFSSSSWNVDGKQRCVGMPVRAVRASH